MTSTKARPNSSPVIESRPNIFPRLECVIVQCKNYSTDRLEGRESLA